jgi:hypothetical protein
MGLWDHDLTCYSVSSAVPTLGDALTDAVNAGTLPVPCGAKAARLVERVIDADSWDVLSGGEYNWLNQLWRALVHNDRDAPPDCLEGPAPGQTFTPGQTWTPPDDDPQPPSDIPWGWIIAGTGICGIAALYWFVWRKKR